MAELSRNKMSIKKIVFAVKIIKNRLIHLLLSLLDENLKDDDILVIRSTAIAIDCKFNVLYWIGSIIKREDERFPLV